jgi:hypothetical protein
VGVIVAEDSAIIGSKEMRQQEREVISNDFAFSVDPNLFAKDTDAASATEASFIIGFLSKAASTHRGRLLQVTRDMQHLFECLLEMVDLALGIWALSSTTRCTRAAVPKLVLAVGDLTVCQPHPRFHFETPDSRTFVELAPETSRIESGGIGIEGCSARDNVLIAADHLSCAIPDYTFCHELIIGFLSA